MKKQQMLNIMFIVSLFSAGEGEAENKYKVTMVAA